MSKDHIVMPTGNENDENKEKETPAGSSPAEKTDPNPSGSDPAGEGTNDNGADDKGAESKAEPMIPKHRFDEILVKNKKLETDLGALNDKFNRMGEALTGKDKSDAADEEIDALARKYNVPTNFMEDLIKVAEKRSQKALSGDMAGFKKAQAESEYERELNQLATEFPDAADMTKEDREALRKMAFDPKYSRTPLSDVYKISQFGKTPSTGKRKTVESSRGGAGRSGTEDVDISSMSIEDFEKFSNQLAKQGK